MRVIEKADIAPLEPLLCSVAAAVKLTGRSERWIYHAIATNQLEGVKSDNRTLLLVQSVKDYVAKLRQQSPAKGCALPRRQPDIAPRPKRKPQHLRKTETANA